MEIEEIKELAMNARDSLWSQAEGLGREPKVYLHWSAGRYDTVFDDYHVNIKGDGEIVVTSDFDEVLNHTWKRNTGSVGVSLCAAYQATSNDLGDYAPTEDQIEVMAKVVAAICEGIGIPIDRDHVLTHGEAADNLDGLNCHEDYGPCTTVERWDLQYLGTEESPVYLKDYDDPRTGGNVLRGKAIWYSQQFGWTEEQVEEEMRYDSFEDLPDWAKPTIQKLMDKGLLNNLDLSMDMIRMFVINDRAGLYGE